MRLVCAVNSRMLSDLSSQLSSSRHSTTIVDFESAAHLQRPQHRTGSQQASSQYRGSTTHHRSNPLASTMGISAPCSLPLIPNRLTMSDLPAVTATHSLHPASLNPADAYSHTYMSVLPHASESGTAPRHSSSYYAAQTSTAAAHSKVAPAKQSSVPNASESSSSSSAGAVVGVCVQPNTVTASH